MYVIVVMLQGSRRKGVWAVQFMNHVIHPCVDVYNYVPTAKPTEGPGCEWFQT